MKNQGRLLSSSPGSVCVMQQAYYPQVIDQILHSLKINPRCKNACFIVEQITPLAMVGFSLAQIHYDLSPARTYFVSLPLEPFGNQFVSCIPGKPVQYNRVLWICVYGSDEYLDKLREVQITHQENLSYLADQTGFLSYRKAVPPLQPFLPVEC